MYATAPTVLTKAPKPDWRAEEVGQRILREFGLVQGMRGTWESHWQEIAERLWPSMSWKFNSYGFTSGGQKKTEFVFDSTAALSLNRFSAILDSLLTPRNQTWHSLRANDPALNKRRDVRLWFEDVTKLLFQYRYAAKSNFPSQNSQNYKALGAFGSGCLFIDALANDRGLRYRTIGLGEIYFVENHQGIVDKCFRHFDLTARQAIQKWGAKLPDSIEALAEKDPETVCSFLHLVEPRLDHEPDRKDAKGKPFASYYLYKQDSKIVEEGGYYVFPYAISRYEQYPGEIYGRSIAMDLLPAIKTLNEEKKTMLKQGQRIVDPVLLAHDDGVLDGFSLKPGAINHGGVTADGQPLVHTLPTGNLAVGKDLMDDERAIIKDGFLVSLFQLLVDSPQKTATEVLELAKEKGILIAPTIGRQQSEYLGPCIDRELDVLSQQGLLPPMPEALRQAQGDYKAVYDSPLSRSQKAEEASGTMRTVQSAIEVANVTQDMSILDHFDWDVIIPAMAEIQGVPFHWMRDGKMIGAMRQQRAQMQAEQQKMQAAPGAAAMASSVAKVKAAGV